MMTGFQWGMGWMSLMPILWIALIIALIFFFIQVGRNTYNNYDSRNIRRSKFRCKSCDGLVESDWKVCPYCESPLRINSEKNKKEKL